MKETPNRGYPYPECDPPYVKDTADLPYDLKILATAMDTDFTTINTVALGVLNPPATSMSANPSTLDTFNARLVLNLTDYDNAAQASIPASGMFAKTDGLYHIIARRSYSQSASAGTQVAIKVNGAIVDLVSISPVAAASTVSMTCESVQILNAGDYVTAFSVEANNVADGSAQLQMHRILAL
jgi:hypothetical protein